MNKARKLTAILFSALLISACTDTHVASTAPSSSTTLTTQALDSTSMAQISQMLEELEARQDDPVGFQVVYYQPDTNERAFRNFYQRASDLKDSEQQGDQNTIQMTPEQKQSVDEQMIAFNHELISILATATYLSDNSGETTPNMVIHISNLSGTDDNSIGFDIYDDGSITLTLDGLLTHGMTNDDTLQAIHNLFVPLIETYSGGQFHWVDELSN